VFSWNPATTSSALAAGKHKWKINKL